MSEVKIPIKQVIAMVSQCNASVTLYDRDREKIASGPIFASGDAGVMLEPGETIAWDRIGFYSFEVIGEVA